MGIRVLTMISKMVQGMTYYPTTKVNTYNVLNSHLDGTYSGIIQVFDTKKQDL